MAYLDRLQGNIRKRLMTAIDASRNGEIDVSDITNEVHLARLSAEDAAELYSLVNELEARAAEVDPKQKENQTGLQAKLVVGDLMVKHLKHVAGLSEQHARIRQIKQDIKDISTLQELFGRVGEIAEKHIHDKTMLKDFIVALREMSLEDSTKGTTLRPDSDVRAMDSTIPAEPSAQPIEMRS